MQTIMATIDQAGLLQASRLFRNSPTERLTEILANSRRAGATHVRVTIDHLGCYVQDNGAGISDFQNVLTLFRSGWGEQLKQAEQPAGAGIFSLSGRKTTITSFGKTLTVTPAAWLGQEGAQLSGGPQWPDFSTCVEWEDAEAHQIRLEELTRLAAYIPLDVEYRLAGQEKFTLLERRNLMNGIVGPVMEFPEYGVRVAFGHRQTNLGAYKYGINGVIDFFGQLVPFTTPEVKTSTWCGTDHLGILCRQLGADEVRIQLTGAPCPLRLRLPDRTEIHACPAWDELMMKIGQQAAARLNEKGHRMPYHLWSSVQRVQPELKEAGEHWVDPDGLIPKGKLLTELTVHGEAVGELELTVIRQLVQAEGRHLVSVPSGMSGYSWTKLPDGQQWDVEFAYDELEEPLPAHLRRLYREFGNDGDPESVSLCFSVVERCRAVVTEGDGTEMCVVPIPFFVDDDGAVITREALQEIDKLDDELMEMMAARAGSQAADNGFSEHSLENAFHTLAEQVFNSKKYEEQKLRRQLNNVPRGIKSFAWEAGEVTNIVFFADEQKTKEVG